MSGGSGVVICNGKNGRKAFDIKNCGGPSIYQLFSDVVSISLDDTHYSMFRTFTFFLHTVAHLRIRGPFLSASFTLLGCNCNF